MNSATRFKKTALRSAVLLTLSINGTALVLDSSSANAAEQACANSVSTDSANFTMLSSGGGVVGGTNDAVMGWSGTAYTSNSDYTGPGGATNVTMSSTAPFFGYSWTAHDIQVFAPGSYTFDTTVGGGNAESGNLNVSVGAGQLGIHMLFDWNGNNNIDVFIVADRDSTFGAGLIYSTQTNTKGQFKCDTSFTGTIIQNCLFDGALYGSALAPVKDQVWMLASVAGNGDSIMGIPMATGGPFAGFNANFNFNFTSALTLTSGTVCNPTADTIPDPFSFTDVTGAAPSSVNESNTITVSGLGTGETANVQITGGEYSKDGGLTWASADGTAQNTDTFKVRQTAASTEDGTQTDATLNIGGVFDVFSVTTVDKKPDAFAFTDQTGVAVSTAVESNAITVAGMGTGLSTPINISGGTYTINGGAPTGAAGTVQNGDVVRVQQTSSASDATTTIATLTLGSAGNGTLVNGTFSVTTTGGIVSSGNNFTMIDPAGGVVGGTNDVAMIWDQQFNTSTSDPVTPASAHMRLTTSTPFFQFNWEAHHIRVFGPGTYTINVDCSTAQIEGGTCTANADPAKNYTFTVGANQIGAHMLFDWGKDSPTPCGRASCNIDVVDIWDQDAVFGPSALYTGSVGFNAASTVWSLMSSDWDGDGQNGAAMIDGPFQGFKANFNLNYTGTLAPSNYVPTVNVDDPSADTGCSISTKPVSVMERGDWWLVAGFLAWLGALRMRFKRQTRS
jgi:hypothetical protein